MIIQFLRFKYICSATKKAPRRAQIFKIGALGWSRKTIWEIVFRRQAKFC